MGQSAWFEARAESDFSRFLPFLERNIELKRRYVDCFEPSDEPYDILLDDYEPGMTTAEVREIFGRLKERLVPLITATREHAGAVDDSCLYGEYPVERQKEFVISVIERFGFDPGSWRIDLAPHPFATNFSVNDVRITTRYAPDHLTGLFAAMHECGHGLYEHGASPSFERTPLAGESRSGFTSRRAGCGRTWSEGADPSGAGRPVPSRDVSEGARVGGRGDVLPCRERRQALADPCRG